MNYMDSNGRERNDSGQFVGGGGSLNGINTGEQMLAGVNRYDTVISAENKLKQYQDSQTNRIDGRHANSGDRENNLRLAAIIGRWLLCFVFAIGGLIAVGSVHDALRPAYPEGHISVQESRSPAVVLASGRRNYERAMLPLLKPGTPPSVIWRHCTKRNCDRLGLNGALALVPYAVDAAAFPDQVCRLDLLPRTGGMTPRYAPGQVTDQCDLVETPALRAQIAHEEWLRSAAMWATGIGAVVVLLLLLYLFRPAARN